MCSFLKGFFLKRTIFLIKNSFKVAYNASSFNESGDEMKW